jgi:steroid 5-alpha reductase family enzyme
MVLQFLNTQLWLANSAQSNLLHSWIWVMLLVALICFLVGELTGNYSQVDKLWSLMPIVYSWITLFAFPSSPRLWLMTLLVTLWGLRLSYNFYRKGGYNKIPWKGEEDYRWGVLRQHPFFNAKWKLTSFNLFFISLYQHALILLFSSPLLLAAWYPEVKLSGLDYLAAFFMITFISIETFADNQIYNFHLQKQNKIAQNGKFTHSLSKGFMIDGLWKYVRHPNFAAEQAIWVSFYFFGVSASALWLNWTAAGPILLILLFVGSSEMTERISTKKYPYYIIYKQSIPKFIPKMKNPT